MRSNGVGWFLTLLLCASARAVPDADREPERQYRLAQARLEKGREELSVARRQPAGERRVASYERALHFLRRAHDAAVPCRAAGSSDLRAETVAELVRALGLEAELHISRSAIALARKRNMEAFLLAPDDARTRELSLRIQDLDGGLVSFDPPNAERGRRIVDRRALAGVPLRGRRAEAPK